MRWVEIYLEGGENGVCFADYSNDYRTLLYGLLCVFNLEDATLWGAERGVSGV